MRLCALSHYQQRHRCSIPGSFVIRRARHLTDIDTDSEATGATSIPRAPMSGRCLHPSVWQGLLGGQAS
jgi:hypothetical protein